MALRSLTALFLALSLSACGGTATLAVNGKSPIIDHSVPTPQKLQYQSIMVLPPRGSERGEVSGLANLEKALLKRGIRVISSGVTGRVVIDNAEGKKNEGAQNLTDLERALILARKSNADALLQVIDIDWKQDPRHYRYFRLASDGQRFEELASREQFESTPSNQGWRVMGPSFHFEAKIIDVESGEIVAAVDMAQSTVREIEARSLMVPTSGRSIAQVPPHETMYNTEDLKNAVYSSVMENLATLIAKGKVRDTPKGPSPQELAMADERKKLDEEKQKLEAEKKKMDDEKRRQEEEVAKKAEEARKADEAKRLSASGKKK
jgi:hypothetical protein